MSIHVIMHVTGETPFMAEMEKPPDPTAPFVMVTSPMLREKRPTEWATQGAHLFFFSWSHIKLIEVVSDNSHEPIETHYPRRD